MRHHRTEPAGRHRSEIDRHTRAMRIAHADTHTNDDGFTRLLACWLVCGCAPPNVGVRSVGVYFPANGRFYAMGGRSSDVAGSDFTHPFEYNPATNTWTTKAATYPDNQVNNMACGVLTDAGTPYIYCVGGSAAGLTAATGRVFRYNPVTDVISPVAAPWPGCDGQPSARRLQCFNNKLYILGGFDNPCGGWTIPDLGVYSHRRRLGAKER